jgi:hypothetical protein
MKAVRLVEAHSPLQMQEIPVPTVGESDVLVRVRAAGNALGTFRSPTAVWRTYLVRGHI